jgi:hypothetical protein
MKPQDYVQWLLSTNLKQHELADDSDFGTPSIMANFGFGVLEEYFEFTSASQENLHKEAGDVLAYYVLLCASLGFSRDQIAARLTSTAVEYSLQTTVSDLSGALKRLFRGDGSAAIVEGYAYRLLLWTIGYCSVPVEALADVNYTKLTDRLSRLSTFHGSGNNR